MTKMTLINRVFARLGFKTYAMSQSQGNLKGFYFYILDSETPSHYPHVRVCVPRSDKHYKGKALEDGSKYQTLVSIKLKKEANYTSSNMEFEKIYDPKSITAKNKKIWAEFLNKVNKDSGFSNNWQCWFDFKRSNSNNLFIDQFKDVEK